VRCVYVNTVQTDMVVLRLLVWLYSLIMRHRYMHTHAHIHKVLILYGCKSIFEYKHRISDLARNNMPRCTSTSSKRTIMM